MQVQRVLRSTLLSIAAAFVSTAVWAAPHYSFTFLDNNGGNYGAAAALNRSGVVVGSSTMPSGGQGAQMRRATLWMESAATELPSLGGSMSLALGIHDSGDAVGMSFLPGDLENHAVLWRQGQAIDLGTLGGGYSSANAINKAGVIVGGSSAADGRYYAVRWKAGKMTALQNLGGPSEATAINNAGAVVGYADRLDGTRYAVRWQGKTITELGRLPSALGSYALGLNADGVIVGGVFTEEADVAVRWVNDVPQELPSLGGRFSLATAVDYRGWIVGISSLPEGGSRAVMWKNGKILDMNDWLDQAARDAGWELVEAAAINARGDIAGRARNTVSQSDHGFVAKRQ